MRKSTMDTILGTISLGVCFMDACGCLIVPQVVALLSVTGIPVNEGTLVVVRAYARLFVVLVAVYVRVVVEETVAFSDGSTSPLVLEVPVEACVGSVLGAFVL
jgi:hypothetical protein